MVVVKRNNRLKMGKEARIRHVKLLQLKKKYWYMTGGSRSRFFAFDQLKSKRKSGLNSKLPIKPGNKWTITINGQKTESFPENDVKEGVSEDSDIEENVEEVEDYLDSYEISPSDDYEDYSLNPRRPWEYTFSLELRNQFVNDSGTAATPSAQCSLETETFTVRYLQSSAGWRRLLKWVKEHISKGHCRHHAPLKDLVFRGSLDGTTPLLLACSNGDLEMVKYLVEKWGVAVNDTAVFYPSSRYKIEVASPVFVASFKRHFSIVEYLIGKGADLSQKTTSSFEHYHNMTPFLGALCKYPVDVETIVIPLVRLLLENGANPPTLQDGYNPIWSGLAAYSVNLTTLLVHHGMALDHQDVLSSETVVHHWANLAEKNEKDSLTVVKLCVEKGANLMIRNKNGYTPILTAVKSRNWTVVDFLMENDVLDRTEKINALEMAAAIILNDSNRYDSHVERAFGYLRRASILREEKPDSILKTPLTLESGRTIEWTTIAEVEAGIKNCTEYKIQSYLALLRIFHGRSLIAGRSMVRSLSVCCSNLLKQRRFDEIRDVLWATLDASRRNVFLRDSERSVVVVNVVEHFLFMMSKLENNHHLFIADTFKKPLEFILERNPFFFHPCDREQILLKFVAFLARNAKILIDGEVKESLCKLLAQECEESRAQIALKTLLHMACLNPEDLSTIRLLLLSGANPNSSDGFGNGPLHVLAIKDRIRRLSGIDDDLIGSAARLLLAYGAHLCKVNRKRETAAQLWKRENGDLNDFPDWLREEKVKKLSCQCARVITSQNIRSTLPATLHLFVEAHHQELFA